MATYAPKNGTPFSQKDADRICPEIIRLTRLHGNGITKKELLEAAKSPRSPLRRYFDWDDASAAEKHRLSQAAKLLTSFEVVWTQNRTEQRANLVEYVVQTLEPAAVVDEPDAGPQIRPQRNGRERLRSNQRRAYVPLVDVMSNEDYQRQLVQRAQDDLQSYRNRYEKIKHLVDFRTKFGRAFQQVCELMPYEGDE